MDAFTGQDTPNRQRVEWRLREPVVMPVRQAGNGMGPGTGHKAIIAIFVWLSGMSAIGRQALEQSIRLPPISVQTAIKPQDTTRERRGSFV